MVSAIGASDPEGAAPEMRPYYDAKAEADSELGAQRPRLHDRAARTADERPRHRAHPRRPATSAAAPMTRDDVAATLAAVLAAPNTIGVTFDLLEGDVPIEDAVAAL